MNTININTRSYPAIFVDWCVFLRLPLKVTIFDKNNEYCCRALLLGNTHLIWNTINRSWHISDSDTAVSGYFTSVIVSRLVSKLVFVLQQGHFFFFRVQVVQLRPDGCSRHLISVLLFVLVVLCVFLCGVTWNCSFYFGRHRVHQSSALNSYECQKSYSYNYYTVVVRRIVF